MLIEKSGVRPVGWSEDGVDSFGESGWDDGSGFMFGLFGLKVVEFEDRIPDHPELAHQPSSVS